MRSIVENSELAVAQRWEALRCSYYRHYQRPDLADECRARANFYASRLLDVTGVFVERIE